MKTIAIDEIIEIHLRLIDETGGSKGIRNYGQLESSVNQMFASFGGEEFYKTLIEKAAILAYTLCLNHPFIDGNKRIAHAAAEIFLVMNGYEIVCDIDEQEKVFLSLAAGEYDKETFTEWMVQHVKELN